MQSAHNAPADTSIRRSAQGAENVAKARRRVAEIKGFYVHLAVFTLVLAGLFAINAAASGGSWWFLWVLFGWGIGVTTHAWVVFGRTPQAVAAWEERKVNELLDEQDGGRPAG